MAVFTLKRECYHCGGSGIVPIYTLPTSPPTSTDVCPVCGGDGIIDYEYIGLPVGVFYSYQVFEATDLSEYNALNDANKGHYNILVSLGYIDLSEGSNAFNLLQNMFGPGTTTRANLLALIGG